MVGLVVTMTYIPSSRSIELGLSLKFYLLLDQRGKDNWSSNMKTKIVSRKET